MDARALNKGFATSSARISEGLHALNHMTSSKQAVVERPINRRQFVSMGGTAGMAALVTHGTLLPTMAADQVGSPSQRSIMKVGTQQGPVTDAMLRFFKRHAVTHLGADLPRTQGPGKLEGLLKFRERVETHGLTLASEGRAPGAPL